MESDPETLTIMTLDFPPPTDMVRVDGEDAADLLAHVGRHRSLTVHAAIVSGGVEPAR